MTLKYHITAERPSVEMWLQDDDGTLIDFATGYTFSFKIGAIGDTALLTKTTGITGATGAGTEPDGTPNVTIAWTTGELNITPGMHDWQLTATASGVDRIFQGTITILDVIT